MIQIKKNSSHLLEVLLLNKVIIYSRIRILLDKI